MSQLPRLESRIGAQERIATFLHARIEELSQDMNASFKQQVNYQIDFEHKIDAHFDEIDARFDKVEGDIAAVKENMVAMEGRLKGDIATVKEEMVAMEGRLKGDIATLETRMLDAFKQLLTVIDTRLPPAQA